MSELSTVAIKDGHRGHPHHHAQGRIPAFPLSGASGNTIHTLDAERNDRISRLAGLERLGAMRQSSSSSLPPGASASHPQGYFESPIPPQNNPKERSTVGSASATGSVGGRSAWASEAFDQGDKMSEDQDQEMDSGSNGGYSEENGSLVGFGEGAGSVMDAGESTGVRTPQRGSVVGTPTPVKAGGTPAHVRE